MRRFLLFWGVVIFLLVSCHENRKHSGEKTVRERVDSILKVIRPPLFPDQRFFITDFGAKTDGALCTEAFREAIEACNKAGGGRVVVPAGSYRTGAIHLLSNVNLHLERGAVVHFSTHPEDYLPVVRTRFEGMELYNYSPLIYAYEQENIAITGEGVLDGGGSAANWWSWKLATAEEIAAGTPSQYEAASRPRLEAMVTRGVAVEKRLFGKGYHLRPSFIQLYKCKNILIEGVILKRPPMWMIHPVLSENITVRKVNLISPEAPNGDGCDPECCRNVLIEECLFNTGDDCIAIKAGRNRDGYGPGIPSENIIIRHCRFINGHGGIVIGSELSGGVRNIYVNDCQMTSPFLERVLRIKTNKYRGGFVKNIYLDNIHVTGVRNAVIRINQRYNYERGGLPVRYTGIQNIHIRGIVCDSAEYVLQILGSEKCPVRNVVIAESEFNGICRKNILEGVEKVLFEDVRINGNKVDKTIHQIKRL